MTTTTEAGPDPRALTKAARTLAAIGEPTRLRILHLLRDGERNVTQLTELMGANQGVVTHHVVTLRFRGLIGRDRRGQSNYYALTDLGRACLAMVATLIATE